MTGGLVPIYEYTCEKCGHVFEVMQRMGADGSGLTCPVCAAAHPVKKFSIFASSGTGASSGGGSAASSGCGSHGGFT